MGTPSEKSKKQQLLRCADWLQKQNSQEQKLSLQNQNDIQFIIQTNADRKNFLLAVAEDEATVPAGIDEISMEPQTVPLKKLRVEYLQMECEWQSCRWWFNDYEALQKHVRNHISEVHVIQDEGEAQYVCLWDVCGHKTSDFKEMIRHINYHAYHARLLAIGFNGRATLKLARCKKDSSKRNQLPPLKCDHCCMWTGCDKRFSSIQGFFDHMKLHVRYAEGNICSWAGCGAMFPRRALLTMHVRSHTKERLIACYHCGMHFSCNSKLSDHLLRQNVYPQSSHRCSVCGVVCATAYLLREHARQHISALACALCDMSAPSPAALAQHVRYRHVAPADARLHACPHCSYRAVTKSDLRKHIPTHTRKRKRQKREQDSDKDLSDDDEGSEVEVKKKKSTKKYACHMCPEDEMKVFSRGTRLTTHLVKVHGAQWPFGHSRFRYQISEDGMYRLTTTRYEFLEVSKKIVDGYSWPKESLNNSFEFNLELKAEATKTTPRRFEITLKNPKDSDSDKSDHQKSIKSEVDSDKPEIEITMCDVDEQGNIVNSEVINSKVIS
ncbi:histone H4 transcription factor [Pectinophora gossypiella]|nr:histone H4 transcription factor [Pectinophora gossypiella]